MKFGFIGGSYSSRAGAVDMERAVNLYPEAVESGEGKSKIVLYGTPGLQTFCTLTTGPCYGFGKGTLVSPITSLGVPVTLAVGGANLYGISSLGVASSVGNVGASGPVQIFNNGVQFLIVANGVLYICDFTPVQALQVALVAAGPPVYSVAAAAYLDGYFIVSEPFGRKVYISALYDGTTWDPLDYAVKEGASDNIVTLFADHEELWVMGSETTEVWANTGAADYPFQRIQGAVIEQGCAAKLSVAKLDNSIFWLGADSRGSLIAWRANGWTPVRISNHAVEYAWSRYTTTSDAEAYGYQDQGHSFYVIYFPTADATWVYDCATREWHERASWDGSAYHAHWGRCHVYDNGRHLIGDRRNGSIYQMSTAFYSDAGTAIRRLRVGPHMSQEMKWLRHNQLWIDMQPGVAVDVSMQFSDNAGVNWSHTFTDSTSASDPRARVKWNRLGRSRDRMYQVWTSSAQPISMIEGYAEVAAGAGS